MGQHLRSNLVITSGRLRQRNGRTYELIGLRPSQIMVLHFDPASPDLKPEMVSV